LHGLGFSCILEPAHRITYPKGDSCPEKISEERMCGEHAHKKMINPQLENVGVVARVESLRGRMGESTRQVEGLFESLLDEVFHG